jgi:transcriptional regulator with XRE-family HTH domain
VASEPEQAVRLARRLRELRQTHWPSTGLTQAQLAAAFSTEAGSKIASATISAWESVSNPKTPPSGRLATYARFFATDRSVDGEPHLIPEAELTDEERERYDALLRELMDLLETGPTTARATFSYTEGPITVVCPEAPIETWSPLAHESSANFTKLQQYGDLDALIELYGHLRACNPTLDVYHRLAGEVTADDMSTDLILVGGVGWNQVMRRYLEALREVPIMQLVVDEYADGDVFEVTQPERKRFLPRWENGEEGKVLIEDVALLARIPNPFNVNRSVTICNGVHSRGVLGAVRCLTDKQVRDANERFLAQHFPGGSFALLLKVPVVANKTLSPDLQNPATRLYEWPELDGSGQ